MAKPSNPSPSPRLLVAALMAVLVLLSADRARVAKAVTCTPSQLSLCVPAMMSSMQPSALCCSKMREQGRASAELEKKRPQRAEILCSPPVELDGALDLNSALNLGHDWVGFRRFGCGQRDRRSHPAARKGLQFTQTEARGRPSRARSVRFQSPVAVVAAAGGDDGSWRQPSSHPGGRCHSPSGVAMHMGDNRRGPVAQWPSVRSFVQTVVRALQAPVSKHGDVAASQVSCR
ncbi:hypothetical protein NL676_028357 [Syzygium grande]|nr:hypothetical protein NL676_028357 [Syzygium grande]